LNEREKNHPLDIVCFCHFLAISFFLRCLGDAALVLDLSGLSGYGKSLTLEGEELLVLLLELHCFLHAFHALFKGLCSLAESLQFL
jgi:hypothetical protein